MNLDFAVIDSSVICGTTPAASTFSTLTANSSIVGTLSTAAQTNITSVGALNGGSITSGFGSIDNGSSAITTTGTVTFGTLSDGSINIANFIDDDTFGTASATTVATSESIKAYVDSQVGTVDTLAEILANGNTTGGTDISLSSSDITGTGNIDVTGTVTADGLTVDTSTLVVDATNNRVGIGTTSPDTKLHVNSGTTNTVATFESTDSTLVIPFIDSVGSTQIRSIDGEFAIRTGGDAGSSGGTTEHFRIDSSGNVGIGTTSPQDRLHVNSGSSNEVARFESSDSTAYLSIIDSSTSNSLHGIGAVGDDLTFYGNNAERMRIDSSGNVGIGTSSPTQKLQVNGAVRFGNTISDVADGGRPLIYASNGTGSHTGHALVIQARDGAGSEIDFVTGTTPTTRMHIGSSGNIGIGTTGPSVLIEGQTSTANSAYLRLGSTLSTSSHVVDSDIGALEFYSGDGSGAGSGVKGSIRYKYGSTSGATTHMTFHTAGLSSGNDTERMRIDSSGNLLVGKTSADNETQGVRIYPTGRQSIVSEADTALIVNRRTSDGTIADFRKDGTTVGIIRSVSGDSIAIGTGDTGLRFADSIKKIHPYDINSSTNSDNVLDLGDTNKRFQDIYATNGTIQTSDRNEKQDIEALTDAETRVAVAAKGLLRKFRWQSAVASKGDDARIHFGIIAQDLQDAFTAEGLDAGDYAMFISSTWTDDDGVEQTRLGVRYSELLAFIIAAI